MRPASHARASQVAISSCIQAVSSPCRRRSRRLEGLSDDADANLLVPTELELVEDRDCLQQRHAAAGHDALLDGRSSRRESVLDAVLLLLQLDLCCGADLDDGDPAGELREAFL